MKTQDLEKEFTNLLVEVKSELDRNRTNSSRMETLDKEIVEIKGALESLDSKLASMNQIATVPRKKAAQVDPRRQIAQLIATSPEVRAAAETKSRSLNSTLVIPGFRNPYSSQEVKDAIGSLDYGYGDSRVSGEGITDADARTVLSVRHEPGILAKPQRLLTIYDLLTKESFDGTYKDWVQENTRTSGVAGVPEGTLKPGSSISTTMRHGKVVTIAHTMKASRQILADAPEFRDFVEEVMLQMFEEYLEDQYLYGDGDTDAGNLQGFLTMDDITDVAFSTNIINTVRKGITALRKGRWKSPDALVLNHDNHEELDLLVGEDGHYLWLDLGRNGSVESSQLWRLPLVPTEAIDYGTALLGNFAKGAKLYEREGISLNMTYFNEDDFVKNMVTFLMECRQMFICKWPSAFAKLSVAAGY